MATSVVDAEELTLVYCSLYSSPEKEDLSSDISTDDSRIVAGGARNQDAKIRVGSKYQAVLPVLRSANDPRRKPSDVVSHDLRIWLPPDRPLTSEENKYLTDAIEKHRFKEEQALGLLYWNEFNVKLSREELKYFDAEEEWSCSEKLIFDYCMSTYQKSFEKYQTEFPHRSLGDILQYYYGTKNLRKGASKISQVSPAKDYDGTRNNNNHAGRAAPS